MRSYLNGEFYNKFSAPDRAMIAETEVVNNDHLWGIPWYYEDDDELIPYGGDDTTDYIFLLSTEEVVKYFGDSGQLNYPEYYPAGIFDLFDEIRAAQHVGGMYSYTDYDDESETIKTGIIEAGDYWSWWLRSPGVTSFTAAFVDAYGNIIFSEDGLAPNFVDSNYVGVRPAMWLYLQR